MNRVMLFSFISLLVLTTLAIFVWTMAEITHYNENVTDYEKNLRKLYYIDNVKRGLQNMEELNDALGKPLDDDKISVIHVAGTNGKGSVTLKIAKSLELSGYKVGLLISPHIACYRERMSINGDLISESEVNTYLKRVLDECEIHSIKATFFEITTALSFIYFAEKGVDFVVLETGLGGRLDATNVVTKPKLCIITSIGLEHTQLLGDTVELIAAQKAGIIKKNVPILVGPNVPHEVIKNCAADIGAEGYYTCEDILGEDCFNDDNTLMLNGMKFVDYDIENSKIARAALTLLHTKNAKLFDINEGCISVGISKRPLCRFEDIQVDSTRIILDIAHNPPAMKTLMAKVQVTYPDCNKRVVVGFSEDKDLVQISETILSVVTDPSRIHLVEAVNLRAAKIQRILDAVPALKESNFEEADRSITAQVKLALRLAKERQEILLICGSVFLMAEAREALGIDEPRDTKYITQVAGKGLLMCKRRLLKDDKSTSYEIQKKN